MNSSTQADYSIIIVGHGSRDQAGLVEFEALADLCRIQSTDAPVQIGYLEFAKPAIADAIRLEISEGRNRIAVVPTFLASATHAKNDMPFEIQRLNAEFPQAELHFGSALDLHPLLLDLARRRIIECESKAANEMRRSQTCLVVVGRGTTDPDANSDVSKLARFLEEGMGFGSSFVCFSGTASPRALDGLSRAARLGFSRMVVLPYMLFDGILVKRIYEAVDTLALRHPEIEVLKASYLGVDQSVASVVLERARQAIEGKGHMNCSLCKYRVPIVGYEDQQGQPQRPHFLPAAKAPEKTTAAPDRYVAHEIEKQSFEIIENLRDWSYLSLGEKQIVQRLVHTSGSLTAGDDLFISKGAIETGMRAILRCRRIVTDVTMVESGLKRELLKRLEVKTWCGVHDRETELLSQAENITRSAAGIRRAWQKFGNDVILAIGDAPTAVTECTRLIKKHNWRPQLVVALPVGFVGTMEAKEAVKQLIQVPRITNGGNHGGSPWAAAVINALLIQALNFLSEQN